MTNERFNELLNGALDHPMALFRISRLALALRAVLDATGKAGEDALEAHCRARDAQDHPEVRETRKSMFKERNHATDD